MKILKKISLLLLIVIFSQLTLTAFAGWTELNKITASDGASDDSFGEYLSISGDYAVIGAPGDGSNQGSAYIFKKDGTTWSQKAKITASDGASSDYFGKTVAISGNYVVIGAYGDGSYQGSAYIYKKPVGEWENTSTHLKKLTDSSGTAGDRYGATVDINGDYAIVGSYNDTDYRGSAFIYYKDQGSTDNWGEQKKLAASDTAPSDKFGYSVAIYDNYAIVGAWLEDNAGGSDAGSAYIYYKDQGSTNNWGEQAKITASDGAETDHFGNFVDIHTTYVAIGAFYDDDNGKTNSGSVYIYKKPGTSWTTTSTHSQKLTASDPTDHDNYGQSISIEDTHIAIGTLQAQKAYYYTRSAEAWGSEEMITPETSTSLFGKTVDVNGDNMLIGAPGDSSNQGAAFTEGYTANDVPEFKTYMYIATLLFCFFFIIKLSPKLSSQKHE